MSEPDSPTRGDLHHQQQLHQSATQPNADERDDANNSIIGKVKSRVSSIFPQQLTKWFSPSSSASVLNTSSSNGGLGRRRRRNDEREYDHGSADNSDDESNNSGEDEEPASPTSAQPPSKRSRLNVEGTRTNFKEVGQNILSSTPTSGGRRRITHMNLYGTQKEPAYNFGQSSTTTTKTMNASSRSVFSTKTSAVDSVDIIEVVPERNVLNTNISSRRSLNIPSTTTTMESHRSLNDFKRRSVLSLRTPSAGNSSYLTQPSATIAEENDNDDGNDNNDEQEATAQTIDGGEEDIDVEVDDDNEESEEIAKVTSKKPKFTNGNRIGRSSSIATESGESRSSSVAQTTQPKSGLFNQANRSLRTMSGNGLNFYSHLEGRKSLFSEKNMPGMLNNSTLSLTSLNRRQFNSSIYGSTSALSDSRLLNTSSPFYKGQTTYGGAAAYSKLNRNINQSVRIAPTLIRPTSSLSTLSSSTNSLAQGNDQGNFTAISSTAKRILELINDFSTPLNDAKKMASNIKTPAMLANRNATGKRFSETDLATNRSVRLSKVQKPYTRPAVTLNPNINDSKKLLPPLKELQVPSMSQLLQMKKMQNCTERSRQIANTSKSAFNRECEYKLPGVDNTTANSDKSNSKHVSKIKNKVTATSRVSSKNAFVDDEEPPAPANLPNIAFPFMQSVPKIDIDIKSSNASVLPPPPKTDFKFAVSAEAKPTNNFNFGNRNEAKKSTENQAPTMNFNSEIKTSASALTPVSSSAEFKFSSPLSLTCTPTKGDLAPINNFKFSSPVMVGQKELEKVPSSPSTPQLKTGSVLDALKKPIEKTAAAVAPTSAPLFGEQFKKSSNEWECSECMVRNKDTVDKCVACTTARNKPTVTSAAALPLSNSLGIKNTFGEAFKPKSDTWECSACMVRNKNEVNECVACCTKKAGDAGAAPTSAKLQTTDDGFKSLVAKQTASKWECDACMTRNDAERNKCVCCEQAKPGTQVVSESVPKFNFGASSASKFTFGFGSVAGAEKEKELKAGAASKTENKTGFTFGVPAAKTTETTVTSTGFSFGIKPQQETKSVTSEDVPDVVKTNTTPGFKFGVPQPESNKSDSAAAKTGFSFGLKPAETKTPQNVTFNLPSNTSNSNLSSTSNSVVTSTSATTSSPFNPIASSVFGGVKKAEETKLSESKGFVFGATNTVSVNATPATAAKPLTFNAPSDAAKAATKISFENSSSVGSSVSTSTPSTSFVFGKPAVSTSSAIPTSKPAMTQSSAFVFGKDQSSGSSETPLFGSSSSTLSSTSGVAPKSGSLIFGTSAAAPTTAAVSSSTTGFVFGKPATTSLFGTAISSSTAGTPSVFGSPKPSATIFPAATTSLSTPTSTISSTALPTNPSLPQPAQSSAFVFGSMPSNSNTNSKLIFGGSSFESGSSAAASTTTSSSWPTNTFTFGAAKPAEEVKSNALPAFGSSASIFGQPTQMFGSTQQQVNEVKPLVAASASTVPAFGAPSAVPSPFGSNTTPAPGGGVPTNNVFGSTSSPIFGSTMGFEGGFGASSATSATPVAPANNSNNPATMPTFGSSSFSGGFGSIAASSAGNSSGDGGPPPKKADVAFNFGSAQSSTSGGFSFGGNNNKPAPEAVFKFSTSSTPSFNFTGATESTNVAQPFQFGAPSSTPAVFNFGGVEPDANARISKQSTSQNTYSISSDTTTVDRSVIESRKWLRPIRDDKNNNKHTYINANAISSSISRSIKSDSDSTQASTTAASSNQATNQELSNVSSSAANSIRTSTSTATATATTPTPQQKHYKNSFLMQKYKFYKIFNDAEQNSNSSRNRSREVSYGNSGDGEDHDPKDNTKNYDNASAARERDNITQPHYQDEINNVKTDNVKTGDNSTNPPTNSSTYSSVKNIIITSPERKQLDQGRISRISRPFRQMPRTRLPFKKFAATNTPNTTTNSNVNSKYKLIRKRVTSTRDTAALPSKLTASVESETIRRTSSTSPLKKDKQSSFLANNSITTNTIPYRDPAKYKYVKKSQGN